MSAESISSIENDVISPPFATGVFEALWAKGMNSFGQLHDKLSTSRKSQLNHLVNFNNKTQFIPAGVFIKI